ncbi:TolB family protein [Streptomyces sp. SAS_270]|uniref:TolB family protein n=1 Tax=Streptomyces sp. SAS_270 TaxID=3412748 RepID=UPI00403C2581
MTPRTTTATAFLLAAGLGTLAAPPASAAPTPPTTVRVSVDRDGGQIAAPSFHPSVSPMTGDVFYTSEGPVYSGDTNGMSDVYHGSSPVSYSGQNHGMGNGRSYDGSPCATGRMTAFVSEATDITTSGRTDTTPAVFVRNAAVGKVSFASYGYQGVPFTWAGQPVVSADCQWVAFSATLPSTPDRVEQPRVYRYRIYDGSVQQVSQDSDGSRAAVRPSISADGRHVAYQWSIPHPGGPANDSDIYVRDLETGTLEKASVGRHGHAANRESTGPSLSADGRHIAFDSYASNLAPGDTNGSANVFVRDLDKGVTRLVKGAGSRVYTREAALSADGLHLAYVSARLRDPDSVPAVYLRDLVTGATQLISADTAGHRNDQAAQNPSVNENGTAVAFDSASPDLVPGDTNGTNDVFLRRLG